MRLKGFADLSIEAAFIGMQSAFACDVIGNDATDRQLRASSHLISEIDEPTMRKRVEYDKIYPAFGEIKSKTEWRAIKKAMADAYLSGFVPPHEAQLHENRHGRACPGHPRLSSLTRIRQDMDTRDKREHDGRNPEVVYGKTDVASQQ